MKYAHVAGLPRPLSRLSFGTGSLRDTPKPHDLLDRILACGCTAFDTARIYWSPLASGFLAYDGPSARSIYGSRDSETLRTKTRELAGRLGVAPVQIALAYLFNQRLRDHLDAARLALPRERGGIGD